MEDGAEILSALSSAAASEDFDEGLPLQVPRDTHGCNVVSLSFLGNFNVIRYCCNATFFLFS